MASTGTQRGTRVITKLFSSDEVYSSLPEVGTLAPVQHIRMVQGLAPVQYGERLLRWESVICSTNEEKAKSKINTAEGGTVHPIPK